MNILVTLKEDQFPNIVSDQTKARLESLGSVTYAPELNQRSTAQDYREALQEAEAEIVVTCWGSPQLTLDVFKECPKLKYLCHMAGTVRMYVEKEAIEEGLLVSNWGSVIARSVAEGALMMILSTLRRTTFYQLELHERKGWRDGPETEGLYHQRVGLHGLGAIAQELVKLLEPFGCEFSAYSPHCPDAVFEKLGVNRAASLEELFATNRVISVHASKTDANYHIINADILAKLEDGGCIINTARGAVIDTEALVAELRSRRIHAALDVFEEEPLSQDSELRGLENCQLIPHMGGPTPDRRVDMGDLGVENIDNYINGREVINVVTAEKYELIT